MQLRLADPDRRHRNERQRIERRRQHQHGVARRLDIGRQELAETVEQTEQQDVERQMRSRLLVCDHGVHPAR